MCRSHFFFFYLCGLCKQRCGSPRGATGTIAVRRRACATVWNNAYGAYGAQLLLRSITHVSVSCSSSVGQTWLIQVYYSVGCDRGGAAPSNDREAKLEASEPPDVEKLNKTQNKQTPVDIQTVHIHVNIVYKESTSGNDPLRSISVNKIIY